ncbi:MAG: NADH-ubiquinone oxidoreductase chain 4L [Synergistales bacterium 53_16]|jgi:multicomponent Na+:H+ antiporter subunit C|nr:MAG: NADH-ubiquinone oxidoreductase chain 4L [Synergistales bacterium 53_16]KUL03983.1 MAG: NADH-ubiquinone oxidoreductase chain 4L [Synergistales bacterium 54_9]MDK2846140.1 multicomponent Na+:H+ antiporter subunit [Synergistales bacterium]MDN5335726.1 multicomponent Na+:H+ antiporter subunit [Synergistales bacterium]
MMIQEERRLAMTGNMPFLVVGILFFLGLYSILFERNLIKIAIGITLLEASANLLLIVLGYRRGGSIPVFTLAGEVKTMVLPTPQALTLTAIVIGLATSALLLSLIMMLYKHYGTLDVREIRRLRG